MRPKISSNEIELRFLFDSSRRAGHFCVFLWQNWIMDEKWQSYDHAKRAKVALAFFGP